MNKMLTLAVQYMIQPTGELQLQFMFMFMFVTFSQKLISERQSSYRLPSLFLWEWWRTD